MDLSALLSNFEIRALYKRLTERNWQQVVDSAMPELQQRSQKAAGGSGWQATKLEWAKKLTAKDLALLTGQEKYDRQAEPASTNYGSGNRHEESGSGP